MASKEVRFDIYCKTCMHWDKGEDEDPCRDCLNEAQNEDSHKPVFWKEGNTKHSRQKQPPK